MNEGPQLKLRLVAIKFICKPHPFGVLPYGASACHALRIPTGRIVAENFTAGIPTIGMADHTDGKALGDQASLA